tara:strand:+ start:504 stop:752 length:249 start_codon:yes stop_codon:yes gene_type:complete
MKNKKTMGHTIFVPVDDSLEVTITSNFHTHKCNWCGSMFNSFRDDARYCSNSHKAAAGRKRQVQNYLDEIYRLKEKVKEYER